MKQTRPAFPGSTDSASYTVANWTTPTVILGTTPNYGKPASGSRWDLGNLTIDGSANSNGSGNVRFSDSYTTYVMKNLTIQDRGVMTLTAGKTYIIEGDLNLNGGSLIKLVGSGTTSFYVKGNVSAHNDSQLQTGSGFKAYVVGNMTLTGSDQLAGTYYAEGDATFENGVVLRGQLSAKNVSLKGNSKVIYEAAFSTCKDIFTDPPTEGATMTPPPGVLVPPLGDLVCSKQGTGTSCTGHSGNSFGPGDYDFDNGSISNKAEIIATGVTTRLYFNNLDLNNAILNLHNPAENLFIYVKGNLSIAGQNQINAVVYVAGNVRMAGNASLEGALATGGTLDISGNGDYYFDQDAVDKVDLGSNTCGGGSGGTQIDHFELSHSGQGLTCNPETVVIKACADTSCSRLVTEQVSAALSLSPGTASNGWVGGNQLTFSGGSTTAQLRNNTVGAVTMGVSGSTPAFLYQTLCRAGSGGASAAACTLNFADSGFVFDVLDTYANRPQQVVMKAVRKDDTTQQCVPSFAGVSKPIRFWSDYVSPASNAFGSQVTVNGNAIATSQGAATASDLSFDNKGETTLTVNYPDAGQMRLNARHDGSGDTAGLVMTGSDTFISRPVGLCITPTQGACSAGDASCPVFKKTGETFQLNIKGVAWQADDDKDLCEGNLPTPNFTLANIALGSQLVAPSPGVEAVVGTVSYDHSNQQGSSNLNPLTQTVNEVGVFRMTAIPSASGYFGYTIPPASSVPVGRFVPWDFNLVSGAVTPACGDFSYMSQPFDVQTTVQARNKEGSVTKNYHDAFARGALTLVAANNQDGVDRSNRLDPLVTSWSAGVADFTGQSRFMRLRELTPSLSAPEEPLRRLQFGLRVADGETPETSFLADRDMNPAVTGTCQSEVNCTAKRLDVPQGTDNTMIAYYGRLLASTRQGAASAPLALPLQVQYFEGSLWRVNQDDLCTRISLANEGIRFTDGEQHYDAATGELGLQDGTRIRLGLGPVAPGGSEVRVEGGETRFHFAAPNQSVRIPYQIQLDKLPLQPMAPLWLADPATADHLLGEAIFGRDRGNDRIIYRREVMP
ncbi:DUF6701 domain-containing protein [Aeromonas taiwanensis]|uniref:DUF6701 domain-containing protein n=1 Tax=Aeromonas taiwanensis TaxID=633417 RepID=UPI001ADDD5D0|nr:DUF6701 domain-containing protein [Aeromonas taiwanensis]